MSETQSIDWASVQQRVEAEAVTLVVGRPDTRKSTDEVYRLQKVGLKNEVADDFRRLALDSLSSTQDRTHVNYEVDADLESDQVFQFVGEDLPTELSEFASIASRASSADPVAPDDLSRGLSFYAVVIGDDAPRLVFLRKANPVLDHGSTTKIFALGGQQLNRLSEPVFRFMSDFDAIIGEGWGVVLSQHRFEQLFRDSPLIKGHIEAWAKSVTDHLPMSEGSAVALQDAALADSKLWRKLRSIHERGHLADVEPSQLRSYAESMPSIDADKVLNEDDELVFNTTTRFNVVHLLNEDLFRGPLTNEPFEAQRKSSAS